MDTYSAGQALRIHEAPKRIMTPIVPDVKYQLCGGQERLMHGGLPPASNSTGSSADAHGCRSGEILESGVQLSDRVMVHEADMLPLDRAREAFDETLYRPRSRPSMLTWMRGNSMAVKSAP
jgi:hypothetical protein